MSPRLPMIALLAAALALGPARPEAEGGCETALLLAVDVSNSVDESEYRIQIDGMADAFLDPGIAEALVQGQVAISVMQWSGAEAQDIVLPWTRIAAHRDTLDLAQRARALPRIFLKSDTAPGDAIYFAIDQFAAVADCKRHVIDVSGDGTPNAGRDIRGARIEAERRGITINGIAIESLGLAITGFYSRALITVDGFVLTARGHRDYPDAIRQKILRELSRMLG